MANFDNSNYINNISQTPGFPFDHGPNAFIIDINKASMQNDQFRSTLWTGNDMQITLMSIPAGEIMGLQVNPDHDQYLRIEDGLCLVQLGHDKFSMYTQHIAFDDYGIFVPAGTWHNLINIGNIPLKISSVYAPPMYPWGTFHATKSDTPQPS